MEPMQKPWKATILPSEVTRMRSMLTDEEKHKGMDKVFCPRFFSISTNAKTVLNLPRDLHH